jgi:SAM-dependent methyltransferase
MTAMTSQPPVLPAFDHSAIKARQRAAWSTGDFAVIGTTLQIVGETLCEATDVRAQERVLDVACGNGNAALAAARRFARVTGIDFVPALLDRAWMRAAAEGLKLELKEADAEMLPFHDGAFDVVLSTFGCMFTPDQKSAARELMRVCRPGGRIGLANWTPEGFIGQLFKVLGKHLPPAPGLASPALWGTEAHLCELFAGGAVEMTTQRRDFVFRYASPAHWLEVFRTYYGPVNRAFAALGPDQQGELAADVHALLRRFNRAGSASLVVPSEYLEVVIRRLPA